MAFLTHKASFLASRAFIALVDCALTARRADRTI